MRIRRPLTLLSLVATGLLASFSLAVGGAAPASADGRKRDDHLYDRALSRH